MQGGTLDGLTNPIALGTIDEFDFQFKSLNVDLLTAGFAQETSPISFDTLARSLSDMQTECCDDISQTCQPAQVIVTQSDGTQFTLILENDSE
jgi:hypothetical protein